MEVSPVVGETLFPGDQWDNTEGCVYVLIV